MKAAVGPFWGRLTAQNSADVYLVGGATLSSPPPPCATGQLPITSALYHYLLPSGLVVGAQAGVIIVIPVNSAFFQHPALSFLYPVPANK